MRRRRHPAVFLLDDAWKANFRGCSLEASPWPPGGGVGGVRVLTVPEGPQSGGGGGAGLGRSEGAAGAPAGAGGPSRRRQWREPPHPFLSAASVDLEGGQPRVVSYCPETGPMSPASAATPPALLCSWTSPGARWARPPGQPLAPGKCVQGPVPRGIWPGLQTCPSASSVLPPQRFGQTESTIKNSTGLGRGGIGRNPLGFP